MKKNISIITLLVLSATAFSQRTLRPRHLEMIPADYRDKSSSQLVIGSILLVSGTAAILIGSNMQKDATNFDFTGSGIAALGILAAGGSIPLFISALHYHHKGKEIAANIKFENTLALQQLKTSFHSFPAIAVKISL